MPDAKALAAELMAKGVEIAGPLGDSTNAQGNIRSFFVYDPDGILLQFDAGSEAGYPVPLDY